MLDLAGIVQQIDELFSQNRGKDAEELMKQSIVQAMEEEDHNGLLTMLNELLGYYRETSQVEASYQLAGRALSLAGQMGLEGTIPYATTLLNVANAYRAGGRLEDSLDCFLKTKEIYDRLLEPQDMLVASLYNNMSLLYQEMKRFEEARNALLAALRIVENKEEAYYELAATYTNLAATCLELQEDKEAEQYFKEAIEILEAHGIENAHYSAALASLGTFYYKKGAYAEAAGVFEKAMVCMKQSLGENEFYLRLQDNLEACRAALGKAEESVEESSEEKGGESAEEPSGEKAGETASEAGGSQNLQGLALSRAYYEACGKPMLTERFGDWMDKIAVGLVGEGSDCFGYDDETSRDHDWGPDFCIWITEETDREIGEALRAAYGELPETFEGYRRSPVKQGNGRRGVQTVQGFYSRLLGDRTWEAAEGVTLSEAFWQQVTDEGLAAAVNGAVFWDGQGIFTGVRTVLQQGYPERIRLLKLAEACARFSQSAQYNYERMRKRGEDLTAEILLADGLKAAAKSLFYMKNQYPPHHKWLFRVAKGLGEREGLENIHTLIEEAWKAAIEERCCKAESSPKTDPGTGKTPAETGKTPAKTIEAVERLGQALALELYRAGCISDTDPYLDHHTEELLVKAGYALCSDEELADRITALEYEAFDKVHNVGGRAFCQDDWRTFSIMRKSQYLTFTRPMLLQYLYDFQREYDRGHNLIEEKYGRMMESTAPEEYETMKDRFPELSGEKKAIIEAIVALQVEWMEEFEQRYPTLAGNARSIRTREDHLYNTSYETYLRGELGTYSDKMLELYGRYVAEHAGKGANLAEEIMGHSVRMYGYRDLDTAEKTYAPPESVCTWNV